MKKTFVLDTNVLLHDPECLFRFQENDVVVPIAVIEEIDRFKKELTEVGRSARHVSRHLDALREQGRLTEGVPTPGGGLVRIHLGAPAPRDFPFLESPRTADMQILSLAWDLTRTNPPVVFLTKDTNLRIKADAVGVRTEDYVEQSGAVDLDVAALGAPDPGANAGVLLKNVEDPQQQALARRRPNVPVLFPINVPKQVTGIRPRNLEQRLALDLLLDPAVPLVALVGKAGTGKTLLALAAGLAMTVEQRQYRRLLVARPIFPMGRDLGYLPGELDEKLRPWMQPIYDNLEYLLGEAESPVGPDGHPIEQLLDRGMLEVEALTYIRGRSLPKQYMIVDEAQNLTPHEVKTIVTRAGEGTKVVLTGDVFQIDHPYLDAQSNGLSFLIEKMQGQRLFAHVNLEKGERSQLAQLASDLL
jgi:PhoH-like ATPase